jgi:hypothetical protein
MIGTNEGKLLASDSGKEHGNNIQEDDPLLQALRLCSRRLTMAGCAQ